DTITPTAISSSSPTTTPPLSPSSSFTKHSISTAATTSPCLNPNLSLTTRFQQLRIYSTTTPWLRKFFQPEADCSQHRSLWRATGVVVETTFVMFAG
ncbi:hypothetical protein L195_g016386, partial [Trifolium pratense]